MSTAEKMKQSVAIYTIYNTPNCKNEAIEQAINILMPVVIKMMLSTYHIPSNMVEDVKQECAIAIMKALETYNPEKGANLYTWCNLPIMNAINQSISMNQNGVSRYKTKTYGYTIIKSLQEENCYNRTLEDILISESNLEDDYITKEEILEQQRRIKTLLSYLNPKQKFIIVNFYGLFGINRLKDREIAEIMGLTERQTRDMRHNAIRKIKKRLKITGTC